VVTGNSVIYPPGDGVFIYQTRNTDLDLGVLHAYFEDVVQRETSNGTEMRDLYNALVAQSAAPSESCWNASAADVGFTYRHAQLALRDTARVRGRRE